MRVSDVYGSRKEENTLKKRYLFLIFVAVFGMIVSVLLIIGSAGDTQHTSEVNPEEASREGVFAEELQEQFASAYMTHTGDISRFLDAFMDLTYNCNYQERHYYDGADAYMTEECYDYYVPMQDPEEIEDAGEAFVPYSSYLQGAEYYYASLTGERAECLAIVSYSATDSPAGAQKSYILLSLIRMNDEWKISSIETLDN